MYSKSASFSFIPHFRCFSLKYPFIWFPICKTSLAKHLKIIIGTSKEKSAKINKFFAISRDFISKTFLNLGRLFFLFLNGSRFFFCEVFFSSMSLIIQGSIPTILFLSPNLYSFYYTLVRFFSQSKRLIGGARMKLSVARRGGPYFV